MAHARRRREVGTLVLGTLAFVVVLGGSAAAWKLTPLRDRHLAIADVTPPDPNEYYLAADGGTFDHYVLYHGLDRPAIDNLRAAEVLFLGNSRLMFAMRQRQLQAFFARARLRYYMLGFGHSERDLFPLAIIERYDLHPALVIVNADGFFRRRSSPFATKVMQEFPLKVPVIYAENRLSNRVRHVLHRGVPHWIALAERRPEHLIYRSRHDGAWFPAAFPNGRNPFKPWTEDAEPTAAELAAARAFKAALDARGARLVLTCVPGPYTSRQHAVRIAAELDVPLIAPQLDDLATCDASHLTARDADRFADAFLREFQAWRAAAAPAQVAQVGAPPCCP